MSGRERWEGGAVWPAWHQLGGALPAGKAMGRSAELTLDDQGGRLRAGPTFPRGLVVDIRFGWGEVERVERVKVLGLPFLGEGARFTLVDTTARGKSRTLLFYTLARSRTLEILDFAESKGARVERKARIRFTQP